MSNPEKTDIRGALPGLLFGIVAFVVALVLMGRDTADALPALAIGVVVAAVVIVGARFAR